MKKIMILTSTLLMAFTAHAASVSIALDAAPNREGSGTYRYVDNLLLSLNEAGWETESFPRNSIGGENERLSMVRTGTLDISMSQYSSAAQFVPEMRVLQLPYIFKDTDHQYNFFVNSHYLDSVNRRLSGEGLRILAVVPTGGFLGIFNDEKTIRTVKDMSGLRMRALDENQLTIFQKMGANGVLIPFSEVPNALRVGIADGYLNASSVPIIFNHTGLLKYFTDAKVIMSARLVLASQYWWDNLTQAEKEQFTTLSLAAQKEVFEWVKVSEDNYHKALVDAGITVYKPTEEELLTFKASVATMNQQVNGVPFERVVQLQKMISDYRTE
ncbi:TRAP-type C4-dicarboxylate transport system substrate-binding protein [Marinomonas alcarazii]|uniref:TRAP-type C4-dicarboxylate transport system substrate-binding protein n=1 Tax=Marinomonas alcarazii TaxID=491949 RepID=A0A318V2S5_9GAMM|nr:TRAP transporter substrate-binding protein [Marinomonas alcarazii]PYF80465.1 TRAP-type C4-dicarboxylate transport system substrate-binding protein [Marinomonas alcarazii]